MKTTSFAKPGSILRAVFVFAALVTVLGACKNPATDPMSGRIAVRIAGINGEPAAARTAFPHAEFDGCKFTFTKQGETSGEEKTPDNNGYFTLEVGAYTVELQAFMGSGPSATLAAIGVSPPFTVFEGDNDPVVVRISPVTSAARGTFTYTVTFPPEAEAAITLRQWPDMEGITLTPAGVPAGNGVTGTLELNAGSYLLTVHLSMDGRYAGISEAVHIYPLLTTPYTKHFDESDFIAEPPGIPEPPAVYPVRIIYYWIDQHDSLVTTNGAAVIAAGETIAITAQEDGYSNQRWYLNGVETSESGDTYCFTGTANGNYTIGLLVAKDGKLYSTNITVTVETETGAINQTRSITIDMFDSMGDGWGGNGALKIDVNGVEIDTVKVIYGNTNTYTFPATPGDVVRLYWIRGSSQNENSFIAYYTDTPPNPAFSTDNSGPVKWSGSNALVFRLRNKIDPTSGDTLMGEFTVQAQHS